MMLNLVGLGLHDERDISLKALDALKASDRVYLEGYTSYFNGSMERLSELCGKEVTVLSRKDIEETPEKTVLAPGEVSLLVLGDPLVATTHSDLVLRADSLGIKVRVIHSSSVQSAIGECGLQLYSFGRTITIAYPEGKYFPKSPYDVLKENKQRGLHTLCLLDVKADEKRYMSVNEGVELLLRMENDKMQNVFRPTTMCLGLARLGGDAVIKYGSAEQLMTEEFGGPPHAIIVPGKLHFVEEDMLKRARI